MSLELERPINLKRAYTEYNVETPTSVFAIGFDFYEGEQNILLLLNGQAITSLGYTYKLKNSLEVEVTPAIDRGTLRIQRETDVDQNKYKYTAGALFEARTMDENFEQIRDAMQEIRDGFSYYSSRWLIKDTVLEIQAGTSYAEPDMVFGVYTAARDYTLLEFYPNIASTDTEEEVGFVVERNDEVIITVDFKDKVPTIKFLNGDTELKRGDRLTMRITKYHHTMSQVAGTFIAQFPILEVQQNADT